MNINLSSNYNIDRDSGNAQSVSDQLDEHLTVLAMAPGMKAVQFTGRQALLPETDLPDAYRVWNETALGTWMWINTEGIAYETYDPIRFVEPTQTEETDG